jgi:glycerol-3-phosphate acyltransferase PlsX
MKIALDAVGGDHFPHHPVEGAIQAANERPDLHILLAGPGRMVEEELKKQHFTGSNISVIDAPDIIRMDDSPAMAVKTKTNSSIAVGLGMHAKGHCDAFISAGNTGALLAASAFILGRLPGVVRPTIASNFPTINGVRLMVDVGANIEVKPEMLYQFGIMGSIFAQRMLGVENPRIGLINVGEEEEKGDEIIRKAHELLKQSPLFIGNLEGRDILSGKADVFVCDGFIGNVLLKFGESIPEALTYIVKKVIVKRGLDREQIELITGVLREAFAPFDYQLVGGVPFLGVNGVSLVGHGGSTPMAVKNMILMAEKMVREKVNSTITTSLN